MTPITLNVEGYNPANVKLSQLPKKEAEAISRFKEQAENSRWGPFSGRFLGVRKYHVNAQRWGYLSTFSNGITALKFAGFKWSERLQHSVEYTIRHVVIGQVLNERGQPFIRRVLNDEYKYHHYYVSTTMLSGALLLDIFKIDLRPGGKRTYIF